MNQSFQLSIKFIKIEFIIVHSKRLDENFYSEFEMKFFKSNMTKNYKIKNY
jgi:hypothetical protein